MWQRSRCTVYLQKGTYGGRYQPQATTNRLEQIVREKGYTAADYEIYVTVGTRDPIWAQVNNQLTEMLTRPVFSGGNVRVASIIAFSE